MQIPTSVAARGKQHILPSLFGINHSSAARSTKILWSVALHGSILLLLLWLSQVALWRINKANTTPYHISAVIFASSSSGRAAPSPPAPRPPAPTPTSPAAP